MGEMPDLDERKESHGISTAAVLAGIGGAAAATAVILATKKYMDTDCIDEVVSTELEEFNAADAERLRKLPNPEARSRQRYTFLLANSLDVTTVAKLIGESLPATKKRLTERRLYAFEVREGWRVPAFQFVGGRVVRHLDGVVPHLRRELHPLEVVNWFSHENPDLTMKKERVSPVAWLLQGGDPSIVATLAEALGRPA